MNVYVFMGTHLPEMQTCLAALAEVVPEETRATVFHPKAFPWPQPAAAGTGCQPYDPDSVDWVFDPDSADHAFIVLDPAMPQIPQLEKLADDLAKCLIEPVKVVTCVDSEQAQNSPQLRAWLDAGIYYSDVVLMGNRRNASKAFVRDFQKSFEKQCFPCLFLLLKGAGRPDQPLEILTPDTRRLSQLFDLVEEEAESLPGLIIEASCDLDVDEPEADPFRADEETEGQAPATIPDVSRYIVTEADPGS